LIGVDEFERGRRTVVARLAARLAQAIRAGDAELIELSQQVLGRRRRP
jgi:hypothetical protein